MATNLKPLAITWSRAIMEGAKYCPSKTAGQPGLHMREDLPAGAAELTESQGGQPYLTYVCPCGCSVVGCLPLAPFPGQQGWDWTMAENMRVLPSLSPSIRRKYGCHWHGHLKHGVWTPCDDWLQAQH